MDRNNSLWEEKEWLTAVTGTFSAWSVGCSFASLLVCSYGGSHVLFASVRPLGGKELVRVSSSSFAVAVAVVAQ